MPSVHRVDQDELEDDVVLEDPVDEPPVDEEPEDEEPPPSDFFSAGLESEEPDDPESLAEVDSLVDVEPVDALLSLRLSLE